MNINETRSLQPLKEGAESTVWGATTTHPSGRRVTNRVKGTTDLPGAGEDALNVQLSAAADYISRALGREDAADQNRVARLTELYRNDQWEDAPGLTVARSLVQYSLEALNG